MDRLLEDLMKIRKDSIDLDNRIYQVTQSIDVMIEDIMTLKEKMAQRKPHAIIR